MRTYYIARKGNPPSNKMNTGSALILPMSQETLAAERTPSLELGPSPKHCACSRNDGAWITLCQGISLLLKCWYWLAERLL